MFGIRLGLAATEELMAKAGHPEKQLRFIHLAGTNGKGSTGAMLEKALRCAGKKTGFYTSPHLIDIRERFRVNGKAVSVEKFNALGEELAGQAAGTRYSYFEFATILAMKIFADAQVDAVIWETGMGGRLDATNAILPEAAVITNIALDHQGHLGSTVEAIAAEKAGIIKAGVPLFHGVLPPGAEKVIRQRAKELSAPVYSPRSAVPELTGFKEQCQCFNYDGKNIALSLPGRMQRENFRIVYEVLTYLAEKWNFSLNEALAALSTVNWPGRFQHIGKVIIDGGHNPDGVRALSEALRERYPREKFLVVYAAFGDKQAPECVKYLEECADSFIFTTPGVGGRAAYSPDELQSFTAISSMVANDPLQAIKTALSQQERRIIISGSLYLAGDALKLLLPPDKILDL